MRRVRSTRTYSNRALRSIHKARLTASRDHSVDTKRAHAGRLTMAHKFSSPRARVFARVWRAHFMSLCALSTEVCTGLLSLSLLAPYFIAVCLSCVFANCCTNAVVGVSAVPPPRARVCLCLTSCRCSPLMCSDRSLFVTKNTCSTTTTIHYTLCKLWL